ncbi:MAG TPA: hypothetical protein VMF61_10580 [Candidatus Acidoferrales bacterium]|nr:hypothetical protein [Candidatus Acidoferrales bacterium]
MPRDLGDRLPFLCAAALIAAAAGDPLVESISNAGWVGRGFSDNDHSSVLPALIAGVLVALVLVGRRTICLLRRAGRGESLEEAAARFASRHPLESLPYVLSLQFAALFTMESAEQLLAGGRLLGGTAWLGGPIWFSVLLHVALGIACTLLLAASMRAIARTCADRIKAALEFLLDAVSPRIAECFTRRHVEALARLKTLVRSLHRGERAPPLPLALTAA